MRDRIQQVLGTLLFEFVKRKQLLLAQGVQICHGGDKPLFDKLHSHRLAQTVDGHGIAGGKVDQIAQALGRALGVDAAQGGLILQMHDRCAAAGAGCGHGKGAAARQTGRHADDLRDDITGLADLDGVTDADTQTGDNIAVV